MVRRGIRSLYRTCRGQRDISRAQDLLYAYVPRVDLLVFLGKALSRASSKEAL